MNLVDMLKTNKQIPIVIVKLFETLLRISDDAKGNKRSVKHRTL